MKHFHSSTPVTERSLAWCKAALCPLYCMCDWVESAFTGCQIFLGSAGVIDFPVQFLPMCITLAFQERRGNSLPAIPQPYPWAFIIMISLHFPGLPVMRNESSFGEKERVRIPQRGLFLHPPPPWRQDERGDGRDGSQAEECEVYFWKGVSAAFFAVASHQTVVNYRGAVRLSIIQAWKWRKHGRTSWLNRYFSAIIENNDKENCLLCFSIKTGRPLF